MGQKLNFAASIQTKKGRLYAVMQVKENGKTKSVWRALGLPEDAPKTKVNKTFREVVKKFEENYADELDRRSRPDSELPIYDYMERFLRRAEPELQYNTVRSYSSMIEGKIKRYFTARPELTMSTLKPKDVLDFYDHLRAHQVTGSTIIHYHAVLRRAFQQAFKDDVIPANPFDKIDKPKKNKFHGENYSEDELRLLLELTKDDVIFPAIVLAGAMGLRRSEALGLRWSRIDWEQKTVLLDTKVVEYREPDGKTVPRPVEEMKNKSSRRTLPIPEPVLEVLRCRKEEQELYRKLFKSSYERSFEDYVLVDQLGNLLRPSYITTHFSDLLKKHDLRHIRFHDLRHTFASILIGHEVPLINVSSFLGHSDLSTTANIYAHLDRSSKQSSADIMTNIMTEKSEALPRGSANFYGGRI